jgi:tetratricopeptide (TPR) repeat protein
MTTLKFITTFSIIALSSCGQNSTKHKINSAAIELNNKAMTLVQFIDNTDSSKKALFLLDKATLIDSNYFLGYYNKLMFYTQLKQVDKAISTVNKLIELRPAAHDLYLTGGILYEQTGDSISAKPYFEKSLAICDQVLDTMSSKSRDYEMLVGNKAANLIMLGDSIKANEILKKLYTYQTDDEMKKMTLSMMNKSKTELIDQLSDGKYSH